MCGRSAECSLVKRVWAHACGATGSGSGQPCSPLVRCRGAGHPEEEIQPSATAARDDRRGEHSSVEKMRGMELTGEDRKVGGMMPRPT
mmetsp:Transcript_117980/g.378233  ORF Transcript_117980/g.378233 Transcript_117980/m.378233 type:complete len:88 (-) Transcript_117980:1-264(-)